MKLNVIFPAAALALISALAHGETAPDMNRNAIFASPVTMIVNSSILEFPIISIAYERSLSETGYSVFIPMHAGYLEDQYEKDVAIGAGLGVRKYFGHAFTGSYVTGQSDYIKSYTRRIEYDYSLSIDRSVTNNDYQSTTQLSFGYKWGWRQFTLDLNGGGAFYAKDTEKYTNFIASANVGFPFRSETFGF
jgi:hypothetical protein